MNLFFIKYFDGNLGIRSFVSGFSYLRNVVFVNNRANMVLLLYEVNKTQTPDIVKLVI